MIGVYRIINIKTNKSYIGSAVNIKDRWCQHKKSLSKGNHHSIKLQRSYNKYGENNFIFEVIEECQKESLIIREQFYIDLFDSYKNGYNSVPRAGSNLGMKHSNETKEKLRQSSTGNKNRLGMTFSDESKKKISEKLKGRPLSEETKNKMKGRIPWNKGGKMSKETKEKMKGRITSEETRKKLSLSHLGKKQSKETIENRVKLNTGKKRTDEVKKKMSESMKGIKR